MLDFESYQIEGLGGGRLAAKIKAAKAKLKLPKVIARPPAIPAFSIFQRQRPRQTFAAIATKLASPSFQMATPQVRAQVKSALTRAVAKHSPLAVTPALQRAMSRVSPTFKQAVAARLALPAMNVSALARKNIAANLAVKAITNLATKPAPIAAAVKAALKPTAFITAKAVEAITPIAHACGCQPKPVLYQVKKKMACKGYPPDSVDGMLSTLHDMNASLEKAAIQRLATYEHKKLVTKRDFEHQVLSQLQRIACKLPKCHPVRTKAHLAILRKVGS